MNGHYILSEYIEYALTTAQYEQLEDGTYCGKIPDCIGAIAFSDSLEACKDEMRSVFEDWVVIGLRFEDKLPILGGINLNVEKEPALEPLESM